MMLIFGFIVFSTIWVFIFLVFALNLPFLSSTLHIVFANLFQCSLKSIAVALYEWDLGKKINYFLTKLQLFPINSRQTDKSKSFQLILKAIL